MSLLASRFNEAVPPDDLEISSLSVIVPVPCVAPVVAKDTPAADEVEPAPVPVLIVTLVPKFKAALMSPDKTTVLPAELAVDVALISTLTGSSNQSLAAIETFSDFR